MHAFYESPTAWLKAKGRLGPDLGSTIIARVSFLFLDCCEKHHVISK
jgi:hypothetical protein